MAVLTKMLQEKAANGCVHGYTLEGTGSSAVR